MTAKEPWAGPWIARFRDGAQRGQQRVWAVGPVWQEIVLAPLPHRRNNWFIARGDGIPPFGDEPPEPWPGEVIYRLASTKRTKELGEPTMIAYYRAV